MEEMKDKRQLWIILFTTSLGSFLTPFMGSSINVAIPEIGLEFFSDAILLSWVAISYLLAASILIVPMGRLADMKGKTRIFLIGIAIYTVGSLLSTMTSSIAMLILFRVIQGCGGAMIFGTSVAIISGIFPPAERGGALGINVAFTYTGLSVGPVVGGALTEAFGWRSIFYLNAAVGVLIILLGMRYLKIKETKDDQTAFDLPGSVLYGAMILLVMLGFQELPDTTGYILFALGAAFAAAFFFREKSTPHPVIRISLFTENRLFALANFAAFINYSSTFAISYLLSYYLQLIRGFGPEQAGLFLIAQPVIQAIFSPATGRLSDRINPSVLATGGMALITAGLMLFTVLSPETSILIIIVDLAFLGFGFALFASPNTHAVMNSVPLKLYGVASGVLGTTRMCGMMTSMGISMLAFSLTIGNTPISLVDPESLLVSINSAFTIFVVLCATGTFASYMVIRNKGEE
jgi:EmrB/QacA subfamily drug resistance transporter